jgi:hypothetical protein
MSDALTRDELFATVAELRSDADIASDFSTLIDLSDVTSVDAITGEVVRSLAAAPSKTVARCAFVAPSPAVFGLARMFASYREARGSSERVGVFRAVGDAEQWLDSGGANARTVAPADAGARIAARPFDLGDHACGIYSSRAQLVRLVSRFLADGLERYEHSWYVGTRVDGVAIRAALRRRGVEVDDQIRHGALRIVLPGDVYLPQGDFDPDRTIRIFGDAIAQSQAHGFRGFRVAADMSWALSIPDGAERLIAYEAGVRSLFNGTRATAFCLYHRRRMPVNVLNGAIVTHPVTFAARGDAMSNPFYERHATALPTDRDADVMPKLQMLTRMIRRSVRRARTA